MDVEIFIEKFTVHIVQWRNWLAEFILWRYLLLVKLLPPPQPNPPTIVLILPRTFVGFW